MSNSYLESRFKLGTLHNSWLVQAEDCSQALVEVKEFIGNFLLDQAFILEANPDFRIVQRESITVNAKNISIEQIKFLQEFLFKTAATNGCKVAIIYQADLMNLHAANSCLKILEDTPNNSYIFLITAKAASILPTIRSRCAKLYIHAQNKEIIDAEYNKLLLIIAERDIAKKLELIKEFADKNRELWVSFSNHALRLIVKLAKKSAGVKVDLNSLEQEIMNKLPCTNPPYLIEKFEKMNALIDNTITYDLDLRTSCVLVINEFLPPQSIFIN